MRVLEFEAKDLLKNNSLPVPNGKLITSPSEAAKVAKELKQSVILKAQVPMGGRMKAGGIRFAASPVDAEVAASELFDSELFGFRVDKILVEKKINITSEVFLAVTYDADARTAMLLASLSGGIEVEKSIGVVKRSFSCLSIVPNYIGRELALDLGFNGKQLLQLGEIITKISNCFITWDALLLEINPLVLDHNGNWWIADVHLELDDDAAKRQSCLIKQLPFSSLIIKKRSDFELKAAQIDSEDHRGVAGRLISFDGNLGLLIGGGGASLTTFDAVIEAGLKPANYCEIGGNPSVWKIKELTKLILNQPEVEHLAIIMNVVSNTRVDLVARGVIKGILELNLEPHKVITAFRIPGSWEDEGKAILNHYGVPFYGREVSIDQVVQEIKWQS